MSIKAIKRSVAVLKMPAGISQYISYVRAIIEAMTGNAFFQNPDPALSVVTSDLNALADAESLALNRAKGAAGARDVQKVIVDKDLYGLHAYVQRMADADPANAIGIIESAGMHVRRNPAKAKSDFEVKHGDSSGTIILSAKAAAKRASYEWQVSSDKINWNNVPDTLQSRTSVSGLIPAQTYYFKFRAITKNGEGSWSQVLSIVVI